MLAYQREYLKPWLTLSESGVSNKIASEIKALKAKRSKYFIQRMLATIEEKMRSLVPSFKASFYFAFLGIMV